MTKLLLSGGTLLRCEDPATVEHADVLVDGGRITGIGPDLASSEAAAGARVLRCDGAVVLPGWVQTHIHACQTLWRNQADDLELMDWLRREVWPYEAALGPEELRAATRLAALELMLGGTTTILDMGTTHHHDAVLEALAESGLRAWSGKCMMDRDAGEPPALLEKGDASLRAACDLADRWDGEADGRIHYAFAPRFALSCSDGLLRETVAEAARRGAIIHTHASENPTEGALVRELTGGKDAVEHLASLGVEGPRAVLAHCVHITDREVADMAAAGTRAVHCPSSNLKLASGVARVPETMAAGVHWSLGADGAPCNNRLDALTEARLAALIHKPRVGPTSMSANTVLRLATRAGAEAVGAEAEIGSVTVGLKADIQVVSLNTPHATPNGPPAATLIYSARSSDTRHVLIDGQVVVEDGECRTMDEEEVRNAGVRWGRSLINN